MPMTFCSGPILLHLAHLVEEVLERELALAQLLLGLRRLLLVEGRLGLLDQREHVAHAEDAAGHAVGVERLELVELLAGTGEEDRLADDLLHRQRGAAARVAVDLGEDHAVEADRLVERRSATLTASWPVIASTTSSVSLGCTTSRTCAQLVHELGVDLQTAGGVDDHDVATEPRRFVDARLRATATGSVGSREHRHVDALAEHAELLDRGRALEVGADEQRPAALALEQAGELAAAVVFPEPWRPASITTVGGFELIVSLPVVPPRVSTSSSWTILMTCCAGLRLFGDLGAVRALLHPAR